MMNSDNKIKNTSLTLPSGEETINLQPVPLRNAISTVKRQRDPVRSGRISFKPIRLGDLTQELEEAANEPLKKFSYEEIKEDDVDAEYKQSVENDLNDLHISPKNNNEDTNTKEFLNVLSGDLGVTWLETPARTQQPLYKKGVSVMNPKICCRPRITGTTSPTKQEFVTPYSVKMIKNNDSITKPKIQYSIDVKSLLRTPINNNLVNIDLKNKATPKNSSIKNTSHDGILSQKQGNLILHEKNKENVPKVVRFSSQPPEIKNEVFKEIKVKNVSYIILNQLGLGGSSVVYHCYDPVTKTERAIKSVTLGSDANTVGYVNEVKVLERLQKCNRIIKMFDYELIESEKLLLVVLERGGLDLSKILKDLSTNKHLPMHMLIFYWMEMLYAVKQIHENGIIHSDLKPGNFLQAEGFLKLIDFGIASCVQEDMTSVIKNIPVGTFNYVSPEALTNDSSNNCNSPSFGKPKYKVSYKSDVWSLGCILYQLVYRRTPFQHIGHMWAKLSAIIDPNHKIDYPEVDWVPSRIVNTIKSCLRYDMSTRPSVDDLIQEYEDIYN